MPTALFFYAWCRQAAEEAERRRLAEMEHQRLKELQRLEASSCSAFGATDGLPKACLQALACNYFAISMPPWQRA